MSEIIALDEEIDSSISNNMMDAIELSPEWQELTRQKEAVVKEETDLESSVGKASSMVSNLVDDFKGIMKTLDIHSQPW